MVTLVSRGFKRFNEQAQLHLRIGDGKLRGKPILHSHSAPAIKWDSLLAARRGIAQERNNLQPAAVVMATGSA
jgi:hypothetical protein